MGWERELDMKGEIPARRTARKRLDLTMVEQGLAESREKAQALIMAGRVRVEGKPATKAGQGVTLGEAISLEPGLEYYGRGGIKLAHALEQLQLDVKGMVALDVGASTGGFTHCLLLRGAQRVHALDVGYGQLDYRLRQDPRVVVMERVNARYPFPLGEEVDLVTVDVSFISLTMVLPSVVEHLKAGGVMVALVKPQFEARRDEVGKRGVIRDPRVHARVLGRIIAWAVNSGFRLRGLVSSPITGDQGNREFFILISPSR
ncbi:MAG: TlyA family methyltransferase [Dehalococcoidia bacterium]|nr:TlyA family methyltransferase [Dehalococcoidia bacterium]